MNYVDLHAHMVSRTTDDYLQLAMTGCLAVSEPAFWPGWDRGSAQGFADYFEQLTDFEPRRAARHGIQHYAWLCLNPKEGEDRALAAHVLAELPRFLGRPNVIGVGEIGLNRVTRNELATFMDQLALAVAHGLPILIHTPHLEDKYKGTMLILEALAGFPGIEPGKVLVDHAEEHTIGPILAGGYWAGLTLYPQTKASPARAADMIEVHGPARVCVNSACDWGPSTPLAVPQFMLEMRRRGHPPDLIERIVLDNPIAFMAQSPRCRLAPRPGRALAPG